MGREVHVEVAASESRVWEVLTDVESWPAWTRSITSLKRLDDGALGVGSRVRITQPKLRAMDWIVTEFEPGRFFVWEARQRGLTVVARHSVRTDDRGIVTLTLNVDQLGALARIVEPLTKNRTALYLQLEAEGHRRCAELVEPT